MTTWDIKVHDTSLQHSPAAKTDKSSLLSQPQAIRTVTVHHSRLGSHGEGDHVIVIKWDDDNGQHTKKCLVDGLMAKKRMQRHRAAGAFTDWGRIEVHLEYEQPRVFIYSGIEEKGYEATYLAQHPPHSPASMHVHSQGLSQQKPNFYDEYQWGGYKAPGTLANFAWPKPDYPPDLFADKLKEINSTTKKGEVV